MKHSQDIQGLINIKTHRGERRGSISKSGRALFLDLYVQEKEKARLENELKLIYKKALLHEKKLEATKKHIDQIRSSINAFEKEEENSNVRQLPLRHASETRGSAPKNHRKKKAA